MLVLIVLCSMACALLGFRLVDVVAAAVAFIVVRIAVDELGIKL